MSIDKVSGIAASIVPDVSERAPTRAGEASQARPQPARPQPVPRTTEEIARQLESYVRSVNRALEFRVDPDSGHTVISVRDAQTGDLIRQIPSEEVLRFAELVADQTVVLLDEKA
jgi:flagellar protein FlaG